MANKVFANNNEVSCKAAKGMTIAALPDTCFTPPENPATPPGVPIPYPNTGKASDTTKGSKTVKITKKEVGLKNKSYFKTSYGDEAGCAAKKGVITSVNRGKVYFQAWSSDVKFEGENAVRHFDMTTNNHASGPGDTPPWVYVDAVAACKTEDCDEYEEEEKKACAGAKKHPDGGLDCDDDCKKAKACVLTPKENDKEFCCNPDTTGDHLVEVNCFTQKAGRGGLSGQTAWTEGGKRKTLKKAALIAMGISPDTKVSKPLPLGSQFAKYDPEKALCVCVGPNHSEPKHHALQSARDAAKRKAMRRDGGQPIWSFGPDGDSHWTYDEASAAGAMAHHEVFPHCNPYCIKQQLDAYHVDEAGIPPAEEIKTQVVLG